MKKKYKWKAKPRRLTKGPGYVISRGKVDMRATCIESIAASPTFRIGIFRISTKPRRKWS